MIDSCSDTDDILTKIEASLDMIEASCEEETDSIMNDSRANQTKSKESKEESSITTNSSISLEKRGYLKTQHLHTINEGNSSSDISSKKSQSSSLAYLKDSATSKSEVNFLERMTRAKL